VAVQNIEQLRQLRETVDFSDWVDRREETEDLLRATIDALIALGPGARRESVVVRLRGAVEGLNALDTDGFIGTIEREDLCDLLYKIGEAAGVSADDEWVDEYRDW